MLNYLYTEGAILGVAPKRSQVKDVIETSLHLNTCFNAYENCYT